jgi:hypothetical protein
MNEWIDQRGQIPKWSERTMEHVHRGNEVGHANGGHNGILVSSSESDYTRI